MRTEAVTNAAVFALVIAVVSSATEQNITTPPPLESTTMPLFMTTPPKLDRAHKNKLLVEAPCEQYCKYVVWQIKAAGESTWRNADAEPHSNFPDTFYVRSLRSDTTYLLRALLKQPRILSIAYAHSDVPTLEARTCPDSPPPVSNLHAPSAGPGWLEVRWTPPPKEQCKSHLYYQARYAPNGNYFSSWRPYGFYRNELWVHFRPTHPCAVWPAEFCMLVTDGVKAGEQHVVEVRVSRFDELLPALSESRKVVVRADTSCVANDSCGVIGAAPAAASIDASAAPGASTRATDEVDVDDADIVTTTPHSNSTRRVEMSPSPSDPSIGGEEVVEHRSHASAHSSGDSAFGRLGAVFLAMLLVTCAALPIAFLYGKRRGARQAVELHMVPAWRRRMGGDDGSQPVLVEDAEEEPGVENQGTTLQVDQHGRYSWAKLLPVQDN